ncbi:hypothetical protein [Neorhodopirellula pilleata]|uniref:hypothetical protein n=1 Tax=Neorhodopirellula pilleata TaxID=2714738 RepID=UPI0011B55585|nr:hypothetical protein [Neorhodopirellula pilleata]
MQALSFFHRPRFHRSIVSASSDQVVVVAACGDDPLGWMRRRLRSTLFLGALLIAAQTLSAIATPGRADRDADRHSANQSFASSELEPDRIGRAVLPVGWRRTSEGWEHVSTWGWATQNELTLSQRIVAQRRAEPVWLQAALAKIRRTPPGCFALAQLLCVGILFLVCRDQTCPRPVR